MTVGAVWLAVAALWVGCLVPGPWWLGLPGAAALLLFRHAPAVARTAVMVLALVAVGSGGAGARVALLDSGPLMALAQQGGEADMSGLVATDPRPTVSGSWLVLRVTSLDGRPSGRRALLRLNGGADAPDLGARVAFTGTAQPLADDDFDRYLRRLHVGVAVNPVSPLEQVEDPPAGVAATTAVRERVRTMAARHLPADHAALLSGLVAGDTTGLSEATEDTMLAAGLTHLVAVSGSNVALVLAGTIGLSVAAGLGAKGQRRVAVVALVWFVVLVRGEPSVLRAAGMALLVLASAALGRGKDARHTLGIAALLLLLVDPFLAGQLGFALSVLATAGVLVVGPAAATRIPGPRALATLLGATVGAQVGVAPVLIATAGALPLGAVPANLIAVPAAAAASAIGVTAALLAQVMPSLGAVLAAAAWPALSVVLTAGRVFADTPALTLAHLAGPSGVVLAAAVLAGRRAPRMALASVGVVVVVTVVGPLGGGSDVTTLTLTAFDVGQGDALLVEVPGLSGGQPARMLVDGGPDQRLAMKLLRDRGINRLDVVAISHPHADHTEGLPAVLSRLHVSALVVGPTPAQQLDDPASSAIAAEAVASQRSVPLLRAAAGQRFNLGAAVVEVLSPPADGSLGMEPNDNSLVLRVTHGMDSILLTGDVEEAAQRRLLARPDLLAADVLKVPHHGGNTNAEGFLDAVGADTAVIGVGAENDYGHPHPDVLADLAGSRILRTDVAGTISAAIE